MQNVKNKVFCSADPRNSRLEPRRSTSNYETTALMMRNQRGSTTSSAGTGSARNERGTIKQTSIGYGNQLSNVGQKLFKRMGA